MEYWNLNWGKRRAKIGPNRLIEAKTGGTILGKNEQKCSTFKLFFARGDSTHEEKNGQNYPRKIEGGEEE
jgi:hypothetical protein